MWQELKATDYIIIILGIWLTLLSFYILKTVSNLRKITKSVKGQNLEQILNNIFERQKIQTKTIDELSVSIQQIDKQLKGNIAKYALVRYNPFEDTGGDQSFALALLDGTNNGIVISSLHSRGGTRVYAKQVSGAKPTNHQFSKEEKEVVEKAARRESEGTR
ncbi:hypothetical protein A3F02_03940 [Candidatus Curtissbacteria bacterium RIFCSPHIGHO2_12_FULL_38_9b]|uniref:DUF4446 domain-containing protein n=2 Tax=Candidatus Curtissiibacteriota TaxID=1752717 RepID=A0A1F5GXM1_9BACT|nr:MAG: hypothetical protein A3A48_04275 [Candidatus Curtissbacteria bacterium RIFCSPLOWO2_01_FULL_37_9]OGD96672.1 MAG: hypothetical protein A3F02_03940 [Candidatus Curtissbacteria bacterium RIFCSPHIGHO2_12_FULL_38_9b]